MGKIFLKSPAKINLSLKIGKKINYQYHDIQSIIFLINLHDQITIKKLLEKKTHLNLLENLNVLFSVFFYCYLIVRLIKK